MIKLLIQLYRILFHCTFNDCRWQLVSEKVQNLPSRDIVRTTIISKCPDCGSEMTEKKEVTS